MEFQNAAIQEINTDFLAAHQVRLFVKREDLIHPLIKGNKWYKLKYNIQEAQNQGSTKLLTFGGAFSNHIYASASAGKIFGLQTIGIIRGEETLPLNPILSHAISCGMQISYLDRATYRYKTDLSFIQFLKAQFGDFYLIPEGGTNDLAVKGTAEILQNIDTVYDYVCCACGTGGTLAGLVVSENALLQKTQIIGFSVLKGSFLAAEVEKLLQSVEVSHKKTWSINEAYHFGGYAKTTPILLDFVSHFNHQYQIPIEPIYTGKLFYGIFDLIKKGYFAPNSRILVIHSGGVYGGI
jgi:1-aminocyclopropane-1-carboxylate deaminase